MLNFQSGKDNEYVEESLIKLFDKGSFGMCGKLFTLTEVIFHR